MTESIKAAMHTFAAGIVTALGFSAASANFVYIFLISMLPIVELRGAIPVAFALGLNPLHAFIVSVLGNLLPVPFILLLITPLCTYLKKTRLFEWFPRIVESRVEKNREKVTRYASFGLFLFVAIPLPGTGAWTGALVAALMEMRMKRALPAIFLGVLIAATIVTTVATLGVEALSFLYK
mgnify:CR=1 FL=1